MSEYIDSIKRVKEHRIHKVNNSIGMNEAFLAFRKYRKDINSRMFRTIIKTVNLLLQEQLALGEDIKLPKRMGYLELRKFKTKVEFIDNKLKTNYPVDWNATLKLWEENSKAKLKKTLVRAEVPYVFRVLYKKTNATFNNKGFYEFTPNRELKKLLKKNISDNKIDAFIFKRQ